jgi:hypothetical protein
MPLKLTPINDYAEEIAWLKEKLKEYPYYGFVTTSNPDGFAAKADTTRCEDDREERVSSLVNKTTLVFLYKHQHNQVTLFKAPQHIIGKFTFYRDQLPAELDWGGKPFVGKIDYSAITKEIVGR